MGWSSSSLPKVPIALLRDSSSTLPSRNKKEPKIRGQKKKRFQQLLSILNAHVNYSVTRKKSPNVYKSRPKMISLEKLRF